MKKFLITLMLFIFFINPANAACVRFIQVTDVHLTKENAKYLKNFVDDINNNFNNLDFVVFTGDNINRPNPYDLILFLNIVKKLKVRAYITLGNHDLLKTKGMTKENYMRAVRKKLGRYHSNKPQYVFIKNDIVFIVMNGVKEFIPDANGYYRKDELIFLDKMLNKYKNKKVVILQHFPLLDTKVKGHGLYKKEEYEKVLNKHNNVAAVISGHYHEDREKRINNTYHIVTKNFSNNMYYKLIKIYTENDLVFTSLVDNGREKWD